MLLFCHLSPGLLDYFSESNFAGQAIVVVLIILSLAAWTIMIGKHLDLMRLRNSNLLIDKKLTHAASLMSLNVPKAATTLPPYAALIAHAIQVFDETQDMDVEDASIRLKRLNHIENALYRVVAEKCLAYESKMLFLGTIISGAPFLGLLGTAWGVMDAFGAVSMQATVTLQMLAPGVSGSLLTTVAALLVAIPSVFGYNYLTARTKMMVLELENFSSRLLDRIERELEVSNVVYR